MATNGGPAPTGPDGGATSSRGRGDGNRGRGRGGNRGGRNRGGGGGDGAGPKAGAGAGAGAGRGGSAHRGRGRGGNSNNGAHAGSNTDAPKAASGAMQAFTNPADAKPKAEAGEGKEDEDAEVCFICANPVQHHSCAPCNHLTCHICALRMRALYKTKDCATCRTPAPFVIFTDDATKRFEEYTDANISTTDINIGIRYTNEEIVGDTVLLLRYNCPDLDCDFAGLGWPDLHRHVRGAHHKKMCDLCTRNKKVFTHEHELFTDKELQKHMQHGDDRPGDIAQTGFKGHPLCSFCGERFYDDDKLYEHCRNKHERCFICDRRDSRTPHYYMNYDTLEEHFKNGHFLCLDRECLEKKFVVFESEMDLKAHQLSEHADSLSKDVRRDARMVDLSNFELRPSYQPERGRGGRNGGRGGGGGSGGEGGREGRGRGRDPNAEALPRSSAQPLRRDEIAFQRQMAIHSAQSVSNRTFGGQLTTTANASGPTPAVRQQNNGGPSTGAAAATQPQPLADAMESLSVADQAHLSPQDRARLVRHGAVLERASNLLGNDSTKMNTFRSHISSFKNGGLSAPQLIEAFFALFDTNANALGTLVREVADLFEDKTKADALRKAWEDWRAINQDYPSLPGLGGMQGATTSSSGWAAAAANGPSTQGRSGNAAQQQKHTTRVLKLKNSTRRGSAAGLPVAATTSSGPSSIQWANSSAPKATTSAAFPALPGKTSKPYQPSWIGGTAAIASGSGNGSTSRSSGTSTPVSRQAPRGSASSSTDAFPALPAAPKPQSTIFGYGTGIVRRDLSNFGVGRETGFSWTASGSGSGGAARAADSNDAPSAESGGGGGKGKKKAKKQVLASWG